MVFVELPTLTPIVVLRDWVTAGSKGVGAAEGDELGPIVGLAKDGCNEGGVVGGEDGCNEGGAVGGEVGCNEGGAVGGDVGCNEGGEVGGDVGCNEGGEVGGEVGAWRKKEEEEIRVRLRYVGTGILEHDH